MPELTIRPLGPAETDLFFSYPFFRIPGWWETERDYAALLAANEYRPEHTWVAIRDGVVVARACWWAGREDELPMALDWLEAEPGPQQVELATVLLETAHKAMRNAAGRHPDYHLFLPPDWQERPDLKAAIEARLQAARNAGLTRTVSRWNYRWLAEREGLPPRSTRLVFQPADDGAMLPALRAALVGTLDDDSRGSVAEHGLDKAAELQLQDLHWFPSPRDWWQLAHTHAGDLVGLIVPARNFDMPTVGYIAVVPEQRGHGYVDDLLAEIAWRLNEFAPHEDVGADTDRDNVPMANAFTRAGFRVIAEHLVLLDGDGAGQG